MRIDHVLVPVLPARVMYIIAQFPHFPTYSDNFSIICNTKCVHFPIFLPKKSVQSLLCNTFVILTKSIGFVHTHLLRFSLTRGRKHAILSWNFTGTVKDKVFQTKESASTAESAHGRLPRLHAAANPRRVCPVTDERAGMARPCQARWYREVKLRPCMMGWSFFHPRPITRRDAT